MSLPQRQQRNLDLYNGYSQMPLLWLNTFEDLSQFSLKNTENPRGLTVDFGNTRLGKLAEKLFSIQIENANEWKLIFENLQIFEHKNTIGELDICLQNLVSKKYYHIEIVTKFYLYNPKYTCNDIKAWIGPNRNDSLAKKIAKLKEKQLPLLHNSLTESILKEFHIDLNNIDQKVLFKAWLFVPINFTTKLTVFNPNCICGFYMSFERFLVYSKSFSGFYVPRKQDWIRLPETQKDWFSFTEVISNIEVYMNANKAVLVWLKNDEKIERIMVIPYNSFSNK